MPVFMKLLYDTVISNWSVNMVTVMALTALMLSGKLSFKTIQKQQVSDINNIIATNRLVGYW